MLLRTLSRLTRDQAKWKLNGQDATAFIISVNLARRNLTKGQKAMALAMIHPEPEKARLAAEQEAEASRSALRTLDDARSISAGCLEMQQPPPPSQFWHRYGFKRWQKRARQQLRLKPQCAECLRDGKVVAATLVENEPPYNDNWDAFCRGPLQSLCWDCAPRSGTASQRLDRLNPCRSLALAITRFEAGTLPANPDLAAHHAPHYRQRAEMGAALSHPGRTCHNHRAGRRGSGDALRESLIA